MIKESWVRWIRPYPFSLYRPFFSRLMELLITKNNLASPKKLDKFLEENLIWIEKLKEAYHHMVPLREDHFENIKIASKYIAGIGPGGEFFDILQKDGQILFFLSSTSTYADSSIILSHFEKLHRDKNLSGEFIEKYMSLFDKGNSNHDWNSLKEVQLFLMRIDCANFKAFGYNFGGTEIVSDFKPLLLGNQSFPKSSNFQMAKFEIDIAKRKKMVVISPGLKKNYRELLDEKILHEIILKSKEKSNEELAFEVFYMLQKDREDNFLEYDGSLLLLEIERNV